MFTVLPNGLLLQWGLSKAGTYNGGEFDAREITFPRTFGDTPYYIHGTQIDRHGASRDGYFYGYISATTAAGNDGIAYNSSKFILTAWNQHDYFWSAIGPL